GLSTTCSVQCKAGCSRHPDSGRHTNGRSGPPEPRFANPAVHPPKTKRGRETLDTLCAPQYGADKRPVRIRALWPEVCPSIAQKYLAPSAHDAGATVDIRGDRRYVRLSAE